MFVNFGFYLCGLRCVYVVCIVVFVMCMLCVLCMVIMCVTCVYNVRVVYRGVLCGLYCE